MKTLGERDCHNKEEWKERNIRKMKKIRFKKNETNMKE